MRLFGALVVAVAAQMTLAAFPAMASTAPQNIVPPSRDGMLVVGGELVAHPGRWTGVHTGDAAFTYLWLSCPRWPVGPVHQDDLDWALDPANLCMPAGTGKVHRVTPGEADRVTVVVVTAVTSSGEFRQAVSTARDSERVSDRVDLPLQNVTAPKLYGIPAALQKLEATSGLWYGSPETEFGYHWYRCPASAQCDRQPPLGTPRFEIGGAGTGNVYPVTDEDVGAQIYAEVGAISAGTAFCCVPTPWSDFVMHEYAGAVLVDGPSAYWRLSEPDTATVGADSSGQGNTITVLVQFRGGESSRRYQRRHTRRRR